MIAMHYAFDLPDGHDMGRIRARAAAKGPLFDAYPGLIWKAFLGHDRARSGDAARPNRYATFYLWRDAAAMGAFLHGELFEALAAAFGEPDLQSWAVTHHGRSARPGASRHAVLERVDAVEPESLRDFVAREQDGHEAALRRPGLDTHLVAIDPLSWRAVRFSLWRDAAAAPAGESYELLYLATADSAALAARDEIAA